MTSVPLHHTPHQPPLSSGQFYEQLPMFAQAKELRYNYTPNDYTVYEGDRYDDPEEMWEEKHEEAWDSGLYREVSQHGVQKPVNVMHSGRSAKKLLNGHHRVAAAVDSDPYSEIPLNHTTNAMEHESGRVRGMFGAPSPPTPSRLERVQRMMKENEGL